MGGSWNRYNSDERLASRFKKVSFRAKNSQQGQSQLLVILNSNGLPEIDLCSVRERERDRKKTRIMFLFGAGVLFGARKDQKHLFAITCSRFLPLPFVYLIYTLFYHFLFSNSLFKHISLSLSPSSVPLPAKEPINRDCLLRSSTFDQTSRETFLLLPIRKSISGRFSFHVKKDRIAVVTRDLLDEVTGPGQERWRKRSFN